MIAPPENPGIDAALRAGITALAEDVGRLRRRIPDGDPLESYTSLLVRRIAERVLTIAPLFEPTAAEMFLDTGLDDRGVAVALESVDEHVHALHRLVGCPGCVECRP